MKAMRGVAAAVAIAAASACAAGTDAVEGAMGADRFLAGGTLTRTQPVAGDLIAAGGTVEMDAPVTGDEVVAGGNVRIGGNVAQNLYAAAGRLTIDAAVGRNARVAGGKVVIGPSANIDGNLTIGGGNVTVRGAVKGYLQAAGGEITIDGPVDGDVAVSGGRIALGPHAKIGGSLRYRSGEALARDPVAVVSGNVERLASSMHMSTPALAAPSLGFRGGWIWSAGLLVLAALFAAAVPPASMRTSFEARMHPWLCLLFGFVALVCIPFAAIILMLTVIGIPLAMVLVLAYVILLVVGYAAGAVAASDLWLSRRRPAESGRSAWRVPAAVAAMLVLTLLARIPFLGWIVGFAAMLLGIGSLLRAMRPAART